MYEDEHLESDYEDRNGNLLELDGEDEYSLTNPDWDEYDEGTMPDSFGGSDEYDNGLDPDYQGSWLDSDNSDATYYRDFVDI